MSSFRTMTVAAAVAPYWNHTSDIVEYTGDDCFGLEFSVWHEDRWAGDMLLGRASFLDLASLGENGVFEGELPLVLAVLDDGDASEAILHVRISASQDVRRASTRHLSDLWPVWRLPTGMAVARAQSLPLINSMMGGATSSNAADALGPPSAAGRGGGGGGARALLEATMAFEHGVLGGFGVAAQGSAGGGRSAVSRWKRTCQTRFMISIGGWNNLLWQLPGGLLIAYDLIMVPMHSFDIPHTVFFEVMLWLSALYWTADVIHNFFVVYEVEGYPISDPWKVAKNYAKTWLFLDLTILSMDWILLFLGQDGFGSRSWRLAKVLRPMRVIRSLKAVRCIYAVLDTIQSQLLVITIKVGLILSGVLFLAHYVACAWGAAGLSALPLLEELHMPTTWIQEQVAFGQSDVAMLYLHSLLWALAMSGMCTPVGIQPTNWIEQLFSMGVTMTWLSVLAFVFSQFTMYTLQVRDIYLDYEKQETQIRRYLGDHSISADLGNTIMRFFRHSHPKLQTHVEIPIFLELPLALRVELHRQTFSPMLKAHFALSKLDTATATSLCHLACKSSFHHSGEKLFSKGSVASQVYYVQSTGLTYHVDHSKSSDELLHRFLAEAALWQRWTHAGWLVARTSSKVTEISIQHFLAVMSESDAFDESVSKLRAYARLVVSEIGLGGEPVTDLWDECDAVRRLVHEHEATVAETDNWHGIKPTLKRAARRMTVRF